MHFHTDQGVPDARLVASLLACASGKPRPPKMKVNHPTEPPPAPYQALEFETEKVDLDKTLTSADLSRRLDWCRREAKMTNPQFSTSTSHKMFGSSKCVAFLSCCSMANARLVLPSSSTLLTIFGGQTRDLHTILGQERLPDGWEPRVRTRMGLTILGFNSTVMGVEFGIQEEVERPLNLM